jgi:hypothetical protein
MNFNWNNLYFGYIYIYSNHMRISVCICIYIEMKSIKLFVKQQKRTLHRYIAYIMIEIKEGLGSTKFHSVALLIFNYLRNIRVSKNT